MSDQASARRQIVAIAALLGILGIVAGVITSSNVDRDRYAEQEALKQPRLVNSQPGTGEELPLNGTIRLTFDLPMDRASVEHALHFDPAVPFQVHWDSDLAVVVMPQAGSLKPASHLTLSLDTSASARTGWGLLEPREIKLDTVGFLRATDISPANGKSDMPQDTSIRLIFNHPVVSLAPTNNRSQQPAPLTISPAVDGQGEWINTSIFEWHPSGSLHSGQTYTFRLDPALTDVSGAVLDKTYETSFTIAEPGIVSVSPDSDAPSSSRYYDDTPNTFPLNTPVDVTFNMPMDRASTESAFSVTSDAGQQVISGQLSWNDDSTHLTFEPSGLLTLDNVYHIAISHDARSADGYAQLAKDSLTRFRAVSAPMVVSGRASGSSLVWPYFSDQISFNTLMDEDTLNEPGRVSISPEPMEPLSVSSSSYGSSSSLYIEARLRGNTTYTVTVNPGAKDIYGNRIDTPYTYSFKTQPYHSNVQINMGNRFGMYDTSKPTRIVLVTRSVEQINFSLYKLTADNFQSARIRYSEYKPSERALVRTWTQTLAAPPDEAVITQVDVASDGGALAPGIYLLRGSYPAEEYTAQQDHFLFVVNANLTYKVSIRQAMVWLTDLHSTQPISGAPVTVYGRVGEYDSAKVEKATGVTADDGAASVSLTNYSGSDPYGGDYFGPSSYAIVDDGKTFAVALSSWNEGITASSFGVSQAYYHSDQTLYLYTDRPIYRPGQQVFFRGILRDRNDMVFSLPKTTDVHVKVTHYNNMEETISIDSFPVDEIGSFSGSFTVPEDADLGRYYIRVDTGVDRNERCAYYYYCGDAADAHFDVSEYRKPEFDVTLTPEKTDILTGDTTSVTLDAKFYSGGPVSNAKVTWRVKAYDAAFRYDGPGRYRFADFRQYWSYFFYDYSYSSSEELDEYRFVTEGEGVTDKDGKLTITFSTAQRVPGTSELRVEAEVSDIGGVAVSGTAQVMSHSAEYYVGIASDQYWGDAGQPQTMRLIVVDWAGKPVSGQTIGVQLSQQTYDRKRTYSQYGAVSWTWTTNDSPVGEAQTVTTDEQGKAEISVAPPVSGSYRVRASVTDANGKTQSSSAFFWASSDGYTLLRGSQTDDQIDMIPDRASYQPGDTASILIANPFQGEIRALVTVERENVLSHRVISLTGGTTRYQIPITADLAPDVFISVMLLKRTDATTPVPDFKMGLTKIKIVPSAQTLNVSITPQAEFVEPGKSTGFQILVTDLGGKPASAQVSLALVDAAVLALAKPNSINVLDHFYGDRSLGVTTSQPLTALMDRLLVEIIPDNEEGGRGGGGGGPGPRLPDAIRENFKDTAYWNATIQTDTQGRAEVSVPLPDNLTVWHLDARAVTPDTHVGQGEVDIQATLPLLIRPETPRFFIAGDRATLSAIVNNNSGQDIDAAVSLDSQGLALEGQAQQRVTIPAHDRRIVTWPVQVNTGIDWVDVVFSAEGGGYTDAARPEIGDAQHNRMLPVFRYAVYEPVATAGQLAYGGTRAEYVSLPPDVDTSRGALSVQLQHSLAATTLDGLTWLKHFPYECNEQFTSRLLPNSVTLAALRDLGVSDPALERDLVKQRDIGVSTLLKRQNSDGGWGVWPDDDSNALATTYVLHGLLEARKAGADVDPKQARKALRYLAKWITKTPDTDRGGLNLQAYMAYVLSRADELNPPSTSSLTSMPIVDSLDTTIDSLYDNRSSLSLYARALLAQAMWTKHPNDLRLGTLRADMVQAAIVSGTTAHWEEDNSDYWNWNTDTRTTAIVLDTLIRLWPDSELGPGATRWLVAMRKMDHWSTTQETAWSLLALADWMRVTHELEANYPWQVTLGGQELASGSANNASLLKTTHVDIELQKFLTDSSFTIGRGDGPGRLYYTGQMVTYPDVESVTQASHGVSISHRYLDSQGKPVSEARVGDTLTVEVTIVAPTALHYPIIEDYYPAGAEPINPELLSQPLSDRRPALQSQDRQDRIWGWSWFSHVDMRDEKALASTTYLPAGTYQLRYQVRINTPGVFHVIPPTVWEFYLPDVYGRGDGSMFRVLPGG